jgi:hypothetical protein
MRRHVKLMVAATSTLALVGLGSAPAAAEHVDPVLVEGNKTCAQLAPPGATWTELKIEPVTSGTHTDGTLTVELDVTQIDGEERIFDWTSNIGVDAVFVKGGSNGNAYFYDPEETSDTGLHAPVNPTNDMFFGLSHVSFCYDDDEEETTTTTSTTTTSTTTTTVPGETTTTTVPGETTTTTAPSIAPEAPPAAPPAAPVPAQPSFIG